MIDFTLSPEQKQLQLKTRDFANRFLKEASAVYSQHNDQVSRFRSIRPIYREAVANGLIKGQIPAPLGGTAANMVDSALFVEELYAVDPDVSLTILGTGLGLTPLILAGNQEQHQRLLKPFLAEDGDALAGFAHSEPGGTANWLEKGAPGLQTTARKEGNDWIMNGEKVPVTAFDKSYAATNVGQLWTTNSAGWEGKGADLQCVVCRLSDDPNKPQDPSVDPASQILILMVTPEVINANPAEAYQFLGEKELAGHRGVSGPHTRFVNLRVPNGNLLAPPGKGAEVVETTFGMSAAIVGAMAVGLMRAAFESGLAYARGESRRGLVPLIQRQSVADLLIDVKIRIETTRLLVWKALHCLEAGPGDFKARLELLLAAKIYGSDSAVQCATDIMKLVGVSSYAGDMPFAKILNDALALPIFDGGNIGVRRRQMEKLFAAEDYSPWAASYSKE